MSNHTKRRISTFYRHLARQQPIKLTMHAHYSVRLFVQATVTPADMAELRHMLSVRTFRCAVYESMYTSRYHIIICASSGNARGPCRHVWIKHVSHDTRVHIRVPQQKHICDNSLQADAFEPPADLHTNSLIHSSVLPHQLPCGRFTCGSLHFHGVLLRTSVKDNLNVEELFNYIAMEHLRALKLNSPTEDLPEGEQVRVSRFTRRQKNGNNTCAYAQCANS